MPDVHSQFPPSSAERHLQCTPSLRLEEKFPNVSGDAAKEGTYAHFVAETKLRKLLKLEEPEVETPEIDSAWDLDEINTHTDNYVDFVRTLAFNYQATKVLVEERVDFDAFVEGGFGTSDVVMLSNKYIGIVDLKYGKVEVDYRNNTQLKMYALGVIQKYGKDYPLDTVVHMSIYQPRASRGLNAGTYETTINDLLVWAKTVVIPRGKEALAGLGEFVEGSWCTYCKASVICPKKSAALVAISKFYEANSDATVLTDDNIAEILPLLEDMKKWISKIEEYATAKALDEGFVWPNMKLSAGRASLVITDEEGLVSKAKELGLEKAIYAEPKLLTAAKLRDTFGDAYYAHFESFVEMKPGNPKLKPIKK